MDIIEYARRLYGNASFAAAVCDNELNVLWKNRPDLPDVLTDRWFARDEKSRPDPEAETLVRCADGSAARFLPFEEQGRVFYVAEIISNFGVQKLICSSSKLDDLERQYENVRRLLSGTLSAASVPAEPDETADQIRERIRRNVSLSVLRVLSANVNYRYLCRMMSNGINASMTGIDTRIEPMLGYIKQILTDEGTEVECRIEPRVTGLCDFELFEGAFLNLVINAHKYAVCEKKKVFISLELSADKKDYVLTVSDNGTNADLSAIEKISRQGSAASAADQKEHLGLMFTRLMTEKMNGRTEFLQSKTGGLTVRLILPRENGKLDPELCRSYPEHYTGIFEPCFCILAKASDPTKCRL